MSSFELPKSQHETPRDELIGTGSQGGESSRTAGDSGAFLSTERSNEKYDDSAPISQRSMGDRPEVRTSSITPRDLLMTADSGINYSGNNSNHEELGIGLTLSPRDSHEKKDEYSASGGFIYRHSPRDVNMITPRENGNPQTPRENGSTRMDSGSSPRDYLNYHFTGKNAEKFDTSDELGMFEGNICRTSDQKQMSIIQEFPENDDSNSEDENENRYYHRYRDMLDDKEVEEADFVDSDEADEVVVPRRINDVSGQFSPAGEITSLNRETSNTVPYEVTSLYSNKVSSVPNSGVSVDIKENKDDFNSGSETEIEPRASLEITNQNAVTFYEKDSWLSDSDKEEEEDCQQVIHIHNHKHLENQEAPLRPKHQRQDSDTGYSSRDNVSESYLTPSAAGTNSETDVSRLHEHEHWEAPVSYKIKHKLLSNVELESTGGSFGLKTDSGHHSRISSAESRHTHLSSVPSITESYEHEEDDDDVLESHEQNDTEIKPLSARTEELEDFFNSGQNDSHKQELSLNSETQAKDENSPRGADSVRHTMSDYDPLDTRDDAEVNCHDNSSFQDNMVGTMPNFFMPEHDMAESLKTLQLLGTEVS